jgi:pimeloyl-ACP methyl ester carboxylesterase
MEYLERESGRRIPYIAQPATHATRAIAVMLHGIFGEKNEDGRFTRLAQVLSQKNIASVRFDYSGHGDHSYESRRFSIANALADVTDMMNHVAKHHGSQELYIIASSFGASLALLYLRLEGAYIPKKMVLLNPVTDYVATFLKPMCKQMKEIFSAERLSTVYRNGEATFPGVEGAPFILTLPFIIEMHLYRPFETFHDLDIPTLVIHGDNDTAVPYAITRDQALQSPAVTFETIRGADHAFVEPEHEKRSFQLTGDFLDGKV